MMNSKILSAIFVAALLVSCSSDDSDNPPAPNTNYFPLSTGNYWTYQNQREVEGETPTQNTETLSVEDVEEVNGEKQYDMESDQPTNGGVATTIFANGRLSKNQGKLKYNGKLDFYVGQSGIDTISFPVNNAIVFDSNAGINAQLFSFSDSFQQEIPVDNLTIPVTINYTVRTKNLGIINSRTVNGVEYENVLSSEVVMELSVVAEIVTPFGQIDVDIMTPQEVMIATNYFAEGVGMVESDVSIHYEFEDLTEYGFPNVPPVDIQSTQEIDSYVVEE
ncbi:MAG TPA: hypothetical protein VK010_02760 [Flavobacteriaceae bacterium]|nr:hypothetical protein [Flavobacteriaceae bacterium]